VTTVESLLAQSTGWPIQEWEDARLILGDQGWQYAPLAVVERLVVVGMSPTDAAMLVRSAMGEPPLLKPARIRVLEVACHAAWLARG
jgi:hypothetical protein